MVIIMSIDFDLIGKRIQEKRKAINRTQENLAEYLNVSVGYVSTLERGKTKISLSTLAKISDFLKCDISELVSKISMGGENYLDNDFEKLINQLDTNERKMLYKLLNTYLSEKK